MGWPCWGNSARDQADIPVSSHTVSSKWNQNSGAGRFCFSSKVSHSLIAQCQPLTLAPGAFTFAFAILTGIMLPWSTEKASFLTDREKEVARMRILKDGSTAVNTEFDMNKFFSPLRDRKFYVFAGIALCYGVAASVGGNFLTQISESS